MDPVDNGVALHAGPEGVQRRERGAVKGLDEEDDEDRETEILQQESATASETATYRLTCLVRVGELAATRDVDCNCPRDEEEAERDGIEPSWRSMSVSQRQSMLLRTVYAPPEADGACLGKSTQVARRHDRPACHSSHREAIDQDRTHAGRNTCI